ncbi:hypothetical protein BJ165DRAFT_1473957 [Panaeolus papilionaceus]|nr:hypothetical protein BJ165DRAFT_1473957 [Panaeolus papilionaceus]
MTSTTSTNTQTETIMPPDVLGLIFNNLISECPISGKDMRHLRACCLVSKSWVHLCRSRLFRDVEVGIWKVNAGRRKRLAQIVENQPAIGNFIRKISYTGPYGYDEESEGRDKCLFSLLRLPNVQELAISSFDDQNYQKAGVHYFGWRALLDHNLSSGTLTKVSIDGVNNLPLLRIISSQNLEEVKLSRCSISDLKATQSRSFIQESKSSLTSFEACNLNVRDLWWPLLAVACPRLRFINLSTPMTQEEDISFKPQLNYPTPFWNVTSLSVTGIDCCRHLQEASQPMFPVLTTLSLQSPFLKPHMSTNGFPSFRGLQKLKFNVSPDEEDQVTFENFDWDILGGLVNRSVETLTHLRLSASLPGSVHYLLARLDIILSAVKRKNILRSIELAVDDCASTLDNALTSHEQWKQLGDTLVADRMDFRYLRHVHITFFIACELGDEREEMEPEDRDGILTNPLGRLIACPDINFEYCVHVDYI